MVLYNLRIQRKPHDMAHFTRRTSLLKTIVHLNKDLQTSHSQQENKKRHLKLALLVQKQYFVQSDRSLATPIDNSEYVRRAN
jgi:hypothetical protein